MHFQFDHKFKLRLRSFCALILCLGLLLLLTGCKHKTTIRPIEFSRPSESVTENISTVETTEEARKAEKTEKATKQETESTYDMSGEFDPGNLQNLAGGNFKTFAGPENGPAVSGLASAVSQFLQTKGLSGAAISIAYQDLTTNEVYTLNADARYQAASVIKVAAAMVVGQLTDQGFFPSDMQIVYLPSEYFSSDNMDPGQQGKLIPMQNLVDSALLYSDNAATSAIFGYFDRHGRPLHAFMDERTGTHYASDITMSAREGLGLITQLYYDSEFPSYQNILTTMTSSTWNEFLTKNIPVAVSSKYGNLPGLNHEIGLVWTERPFAYAVFSKDIAAYDILPALGSLLYQYNTGSLSSGSAPAAPDSEAGSVPDSMQGLAGQDQPANPQEPEPVYTGETSPLPPGL